MSYGFKLVCLSLAAFFIVHCVAALAAGWFAPLAIRVAGRMRARAAARFLLTARFAPLGIAVFVVAALCVPSYLWFEPEATAEEVGPACLAAAMLGLAVWAISLLRGVRGILLSRRAPGRTIALVGVMRPRVVVASEARSVLSPQELDAALRHEDAHAASRDNLKRLLMLIAPDALPFFRRGFVAMEQAWKKFAEWAADDEAVNGDAERSLALADALVRVARLGSATAGPLVTSLTDGDLTARVDRLLGATPEGAPDRWTPAVGAVTAVALAGVILRPDALVGVYDLLERLIQ